MNRWLRQSLKLFIVLWLAPLLLLLGRSHKSILKKGIIKEITNSQPMEGIRDIFGSGNFSLHSIIITPEVKEPSLKIIENYGNTSNPLQGPPPLLSITLDNVSSISNTYYSDGLPKLWPVRPAKITDITGSSNFSLHSRTSTKAKKPSLKITATYRNTNYTIQGPPLLSVTMDNISSIANIYYSKSDAFPILWPVRPAMLAFSTLLQFQQLNISALAETINKPLRLPRQYCNTLYKESVLPKYVFPQIYGRCTGYTKSDVSLLLQMNRETWDYFQKLGRIALNWRGPISAVIYYDFLNSSIIPSREYFTSDMERIFQEFELNGSSICVHVAYMVQKSQLFPINALRNMAMQFAPTDTILLSEADFIPQPALDKIIQSHVTLKALTLKRLYVIPIFGTEHRNYTIPADKKALISQWNTNRTVPIIVIKKHYPIGHLPVDYARFKNATKMYQVNYTHEFEPYYVVNRSLVPYYPEEFFWGYSDKHIHARFLKALRWKFFVLPTGFLVHTPHGKQARRRDQKYHPCANAIANHLERTLMKCAQWTNRLHKKGLLKNIG